MKAAMQMNHILAASTLMKVINVLGDNIQLGQDQTAPSFL
ncbi:hypothetical protein ALQ81_03535 [Pseudomonas syringae pv. pisi]|nr:hypothetical protein ALQ81_03535 [Pseudomonas syringae pv. pisi]